MLDSDPASGRSAARAFVGRYLDMSNYTNTMLRAGFTEEDIAPPGSDRLVDALVAHGDAASLAARVREHLDAGADHVTVLVVPASDDPLPALRALARELGLG